MEKRSQKRNRILSRFEHTEEQRLGWIGLSWFEEFGSRTLWKLWNAFQGDGARAWNVTMDRLLQIGVRESTALAFVQWRPTIDIHACHRRLTAEEIRFILPSDSEYPDQLKTISDPPLALFCRGAQIPTSLSIGVVGTRACTPYGLHVIRMIIPPLAELGIPIISGLALGIDGSAHRVAIDSGGPTVAVLGGGINDASIYPRQHAKLANDILQKNGTLLSEFPPGTQSLKFHFPLRNRIIAGLSNAILVIEASEKSGSLITARLALEENRDVFTVPGPITSPVSSGNNSLLKFGAIPCTDARDILEHFEFSHQRDPPTDTEPLDELESAVLHTLDHPMHADDILRALMLSSPVLNRLLTQLELKGMLAEEEPGIYALTGKALRRRNEEN
ncbi:MAG: DNA-processing protein DprA [bacterium]|nr:DNA-processing protein DprA [bacterium]